jgi:hypothetical protein
MNVIEFFSEFVLGKIKRQPIGIVDFRPHHLRSFTSGYFLSGSFKPNDNIYPNLDLKLADGIMYNCGTDWIERKITVCPCRSDYNSIYTNKEEFENKMNSLTVGIENKDKLPLFVRDMSKLKRWK